MFTTTLNKIRQHNPCSEGWRTLLSGLGKTGPDDETLPLIRVLETNGLEDAIWCLKVLEGADREIRLFAVSCAREVQHLMTDPRLLAALDTSERFANGQATSEELGVASNVAWNAAWNSTSNAAWAAVWATRAADYEAVANAAWAAVHAAGYDASRVAARSKQEQLFRSYFG